MSAGREVVFPHALHPHVNTHTHPVGTSHVSKTSEAQKNPAGFWPRCRKVHGLLWVVSVEDGSRQPDRSNLQLPKNCLVFWYSKSLL